jgi:hypothetical protein
MILGLQRHQGRCWERYDAQGWGLNRIEVRAMLEHKGHQVHVQYIRGDENELTTTSLGGP